MEYSQCRFNGSHHSRYGGLYYSIFSLKVAILILSISLSPIVASAQTQEPEFVCSDFTFLGTYGDRSRFPEDNFFTLSVGYHRFMYVITDLLWPYSPSINTFASFYPFEGVGVQGLSNASPQNTTYVTNVFYTGNSSTTTVRVQSQFVIYKLYVSNCMPATTTPTPLPIPTPFPTPTSGSGLFDCSEDDYPFVNFPNSPLLIENIGFVATIEIRNNLPVSVTVEVELATGSFEAYIFVGPNAKKTGARIESVSDSKRLYVVEPLSWPDGGIQYRIIPFNGCVNPISSIDIIPTPVSSTGLQPNVRQVSFGVDFVSRNCYTIVQDYTFSQTFSIPFTNASWDLSFNIPGLEICVRTYNASLTYDDYDLISIVAYPLIITATLWAGFQILRD